MTAAIYPTLANRTVLISGGATGIGATLVEHFIGQSARVAFVDIQRAAGHALAKRLGEAGPEPFFVEADLTELERIPEVVAAVVRRIGPVEVLINNAAHDERHAIEDVTPAYWRERLAVNLDHQFFMAKAAAPDMAKAGSGVILNMGSCSWRLGLAGMSAYVTAKAAIEGLTRGLARELGPKGIRVNCIVPGFIKTERQIAKWLTPELEQTVLNGQCLKELIEPNEVAQMAAFLASDDARMCTNSTYAVDGGWS
jgi:NAD(P)-dependent dehydrogenase (short-subunit alcohol dehydrogenase family)